MIEMTENERTRAPELREEPATEKASAIREADLLSFKKVGRPILPDAVAEEFALMQACLKAPLTAKIARRICQKSGSHLLKLVSPRTDGDHAVLRFDRPETNRRPAILPSTNAPDIPFCKVLYRPLEIIGHPSRSVIDLILNPEDHSELVLDAFAGVFGDDVLDAMKNVLLAAPHPPLKLGAGEFPIIFIPRPGGGDLQITPVTPAAAFMEMKQVTAPYFQKAEPNRPKPPRGRWTKSAVSSKPQNISGAIGGPRVRFLATMPEMSQTEAELFRFLHGGAFPRWTNESVADWVLRYEGMLEADVTFNNVNTRSALDRTADRLIRDASEFVAETIAEAKAFANQLGIPFEALPPPPNTATVLFHLKWPSDRARQQARKALTSPHFEHRLSKHPIGQEG